MTDICEFISARLDEDEEQALDRRHEPLTYGVDKVTGLRLSERILADVAAKRAILNEHTSPHTMNGTFCYECGELEDGKHVTSQAYCQVHGFYGCDDVRRLAAVYSGHPDYNPKWSIT